MAENAVVWIAHLFDNGPHGAFSTEAKAKAFICRQEPSKTYEEAHKYGWYALRFVVDDKAQ